MIQTGLIPTAHSDLVTDASYDFYGLRLATCSLDQRIKIWQVDDNNSWHVEDDWKAHDAAVSKIAWAHPEFGSIIASSSFDRTVKIWEQTYNNRQPEGSSSQQQQQQQQQQQASSVTSSSLPNGSSLSQTQQQQQQQQQQQPPPPPPPPSSYSGNSRWVERAVLSDAKGTVRAVEFAPHHFGLKLATISTDNLLRIYECIEQPSLNAWQLLEELDVQTMAIGPSPGYPSHAHTIALSTPTQTHATLEGASASLVTQALQQGLQQQQQQQAVAVAARLGNREADGGWCISWCKDRYWGEIIAVGCGTNGLIKIIQLNARRSSTLLTLNSSPTTTTTNIPARSGISAALNPTPPLPPPPPPAAAAATEPTTAPPPQTTNLPPPPLLPPPSNPTTLINPNPASTVTSVSWAPSCGRSYHLVATGSRDGHVRIWKIKPGSEDLDNEAMAMGGDTDFEEVKWTAILVADFDHHRSSVGRVEWNVTGTILSSAGNDGRIRLWKATSGSVWRPAGSLGVEQPEEGTQHSEQKDVEMLD